MEVFSLNFIFSLTTCQSYKTTLAYLAYLGFPNEDITLGLKIVLKKQQSQRDCFLCYVFGATGSGKTSFMRGCLGKTFQSNYKPTIKEFSIVNSIEVYGVEKELVVRFKIGIIVRCKSMDLNSTLKFFQTKKSLKVAMYYALFMTLEILIHLPMLLIFGYFNYFFII